jgi:hypothetical protein
MEYRSPQFARKLFTTVIGAGIRLAHRFSAHRSALSD